MLKLKLIVFFMIFLCLGGVDCIFALEGHSESEMHDFFKKNVIGESVSMSSTSEGVELVFNNILDPGNYMVYLDVDYSSSFCLEKQEFRIRRKLDDSFDDLVEQGFNFGKGDGSYVAPVDSNDFDFGSFYFGKKIYDNNPIDGCDGGGANFPLGIFLVDSGSSFELIHLGCGGGLFCSNNCSEVLEEQPIEIVSLAAHKKLQDVEYFYVSGGGDKYKISNRGEISGGVYVNPDSSSSSLGSGLCSSSGFNEFGCLHDFCFTEIVDLNLNISEPFCFGEELFFASKKSKADLYKFLENGSVEKFWEFSNDFRLESVFNLEGNLFVVDEKSIYLDGNVCNSFIDGIDITDGIYFERSYLFFGVEGSGDDVLTRVYDCSSCLEGGVCVESRILDGILVNDVVEYQGELVLTGTNNFVENLTELYDVNYSVYVLKDYELIYNESGGVGVESIVYGDDLFVGVSHDVKILNYDGENWSILRNFDGVDYFADFEVVGDDLFILLVTAAGASEVFVYNNLSLLDAVFLRSMLCKYGINSSSVDVSSSIVGCSDNFYGRFFGALDYDEGLSYFMKFVRKPKK